MKNKVRSNILWIDDDRLYIRPLTEDLIDAGFEVKHLADVDEAIPELENNFGQYDVVIVDLMMRFGSELGASATERGLSTGLELIRRIKNKFADTISALDVTKKIIIFSVRNDDEVQQFSSENHIKRLSKQSTTYVELIQAVRDVVGNNNGY